MKQCHRKVKAIEAATTSPTERLVAKKLRSAIQLRIDTVPLQALTLPTQEEIEAEKHRLIETARAEIGMKARSHRYVYEFHRWSPFDKKGIFDTIEKASNGVWKKPFIIGDPARWARCAFSTEIHTRGGHWIPRLFA
jgi:hypothetical protein